MADAVVHWTDDGWATIRETRTEEKCQGLFVADIPTGKEDQGMLSFTFFWNEAGHWENRNYSVVRSGPLKALATKGKKEAAGKKPVKQKK